MNTFATRTCWMLMLPAMGALVGACNYTTPAASQAASATPLTEVASIKEKPEEMAELAALQGKPRKVSSTLIAEGPETLPTITVDPLMQQAMYEQTNYLRRPDAKKANLNGLHRLELLQTVELLRGSGTFTPEQLAQQFDFYRINTDLKKDQVRITGYYTPVESASKTQGGAFQYPIYRKPSEGIPSPDAIWQGALGGRGLELAWFTSKKAVENAQLQGSVLVEYPNGKREYFGFGGSTKGDGGSYVFFTRVDNTVLGAGAFPMTAGHSIAIDTRYIPIGATLLAELPEMDLSGNITGYSYRVLFAQDRGGAIKTTNRIDIYCGIGPKALEDAYTINGYGRLWIMMPKRNSDLAVQ